MSRAFKKFVALIGALLLILIAGLIYSQELKSERVAVKFSDPSRPGILGVKLMSGRITVKGYSGKEVIIEANVVAMKRISKDEEFRDYEEFEGVRPNRFEEREERKKKQKSKAEGMKKIHIPLTGLEVVEKDNVMTVQVDSFDQDIDLTIQVPFNTSLKLRCVDDGEIKVEQVSGEIEAEVVDGPVNLKNISGAVTAHSFDDGIVASFNKVPAGKPMSFTSMDGDIDITFPPNTKATLKMQARDGEIYSDFDIKLEQKAQRTEEDLRKEGGKYRLHMENFSYGKINGGGPEIVLKTIDGNIYIRKGKQVS